MKVEFVMKMGSDATVVNAARVSFARAIPEDQPLHDDDKRLLAYLWNHKHISPFFHPQMMLRITAPVYLARQLVKHHVGMAWNEMSRRYVKDEITIERVPQLHMRPDGNIKQGCGDQVPSEIQLVAEHVMTDVYDTAQRAYNKLLFMGVAPEEARAVLPLATETSWIWTGSLAAWLRVWQQRSAPNAQTVAREFAGELLSILEEHFPETMNVVMKQAKEEAHG